MASKNVYLVPGVRSFFRKNLAEIVGLSFTQYGQLELQAVRVAQAPTMQDQDIQLAFADVHEDSIGEFSFEEVSHA